jgi:NAD(P)-dependent dehydrogenase (short-subunit alcohol dehydrogenase family)
MKPATVVLVTGATSGIGRATALHFASIGHHVVATGRKPELLEAMKTEASAKSYSGKLDTVLLDVTSQASIDRAAHEVDELTGGRGVDVLVNNAGYGLCGPLAEIEDADLRAQFDTNVFGLMAVTRAFLPGMRAKKSGKIFNISSVGGKVTFPFFGAYHGTKYAVEGFSDALRYELRPFGISVVVIEPGPIATAFGQTAMGHVKKYSGTAYTKSVEKAEQIQAQFEKRAAPPEKVAKQIARISRMRRPGARYASPFYNGSVFWLAAILPQRVWDWAVRRLAYLNENSVDLDAPMVVGRARNGKTAAWSSPRPTQTTLPT